MDPLLPELPLDTCEALAKAGLLEDPFSTRVLIASGTRPEALDPLFDLGLLEETAPGEACFVSEEVRERALAAITWSQKRKLCGQLAETGLKFALDAEMVASLYLQAHRYHEARIHFLDAAKRACDRHAHRLALDLMRAALEIWPSDEDPEKRREVLREMARCAGACSDHAAARLAWRELLDMASEAPPAVRLELMRHLAMATKLQGNRVQSRELLHHAAKLADASALAHAGARLWRLLAQEQGDALRLRDALNSLRAACDGAEAAEDWALLSDSLAYAALLTAMLGRVNEGRELLDRALNLALEHDLPEQTTNAYRRQANVSEYASAYQSYRDTELAALDLCRTRGEKGGVQACLSCVSYAFFRLGQFDESLEAASEAVDVLKVDGELLAGAQGVKACIRAARGEGADVFGQLEEAHRLVRLHGARVFEFYLLWAKGAYATLRGERSTAKDNFDELIDLWHETDDHKDVIPGLLCAASFFADENAADQLSSCLDILHGIQSDSESAEPRFAFLAASAEEAWLNGKTAKSLARFQEAREGYHRLNLLFEECWLLWRMGFVQEQAGLLEAALESWRNAEAIVQALGLRPLGWVLARARRKAAPTVEATPTLTRRQLEVARLIAAGRTNKEAAAELRISPRTVEMHVAALLERLSCRTRAEAVQRAGELGLLSGGSC